jgi:DNA polymerase III delta subunit
MKPLDFEKQISSPQRKSFYLIVGGEPNALRRCVEAARKAVNPNFMHFNYRQYVVEDLAKSGGWHRLRVEAATNPFGPPPRMILVRVNEDEKLSAEAQGIFTEIKNAKNPSVTVVLAFDSPPDGRVKFYKEVAGEGLEVDCRAPVKAALLKWLIEQFKQRQCELTNDGARAMIERLGTHPGLLLGEVEKLSIYPGPKTTFGVKEVKELVPFGLTAEIYELGVPVGEGRLSVAIPTLLELLGKVDPLPLTYALATHFRRLIHLKSLLLVQPDSSNSELASATGVHSFKIAEFINQLSYWSMERLKKALSAIQASNMALVTSRASPVIVLQELVVKLGLMAQDSYRQS